MLGLLGVLLFEVIITKIFLWSIKKLHIPSTEWLSVLVANVLSLVIYTAAMGYSLVPDWTSGEAPHLREAFSIGVLPQGAILIFGLIRANAREPDQSISA